MAEAEDVLTDAARHATVFARDLWRRRRNAPAPPKTLALADISGRLDFLVHAVFGTRYPLRVAQTPAPRTWLSKLFRPHDLPPSASAVPATDGVSIWLPAQWTINEPDLATQLFRAMALQQGMRIQRGSARLLDASCSALERDLYLLLEACASDYALTQLLPGLAEAIHTQRRAALSVRPELSAIAPHHRPLEQLARSALQSDCAHPPPGLPLCATPHDSLQAAQRLAATLQLPNQARLWGKVALFRDVWTGDLLAPNDLAGVLRHPGDSNHDTEEQHDNGPARSARLPRRPEVREAADDEDDERQGAWMVQTAEPTTHAEDPMGMQRPTDRDDQTPADDFADSLSELPQARLVFTPGRPKEFLLSDDPPQGQANKCEANIDPTQARISYPEWDYRVSAYRDPGATVHIRPAQTGSQDWVDATLKKHRTMLDTVRRRFDMLRPERVRRRRQLEGDDIDLEACIEARADARAGLPMAQRLYQDHRPGARDMAIMLLIDVSGSTDSWLCASQRIIDVEREALLLVCAALDGLGEPYSVQAFSGEGRGGVVISPIKAFGEHGGGKVALRIAALEPDRYTRAGAALRHASALLMQQASEHRLLVLLSDGKPNDADEYEGRYGIEDMRQAVAESKLQGIYPFCLTIDRQAPTYMPAIFGLGHYALLPKPDVLPTALLEWMRRLLGR
jgi:nitric oxide reductase NorD protein